MCNDPTVHTRTIVTLNQGAEYGFEATFQLIVGRGGQGDGQDGSSVQYRAEPHSRGRGRAPGMPSAEQHTPSACRRSS
jgi:hypothetical protein